MAVSYTCFSGVTFYYCAQAIKGDMVAWVHEGSQFWMVPGTWEND